jgi:N-[(2S)-2-amino-2-carboxyethyl]-L-glutamate dehydrogenase
MFDSDILVIKGPEIAGLLQGRERDLMRATEAAYLAHGRGESSLPHSTFLRFPNDDRNRIIALPAYLGGETEMAGIKWISSFPGNHDRGFNRASAVVILNQAATGRPLSMLEGSIISAKRTAASAAVAAARLQGERKADSLGLIGCGLINFEVARFVLAACPEIKKLILFDLDRSNAERFKDKCEQLFDPRVTAPDVHVAGKLETVFHNAKLVSLATTAIEPHIADISESASDSVILHLSLRDLTPEIILSCDNVVDDIDHVCRAQTSIHLAEQEVGNRDFVRCTLADVLGGAAPARADENRPVIFSPFGLGVLDIAVSAFVYDLAVKEKIGAVIESFLPDYWLQAAANH